MLKRGIKEEPVDLDDPSSSTITMPQPPAKRVKIKQEPIDVDAIDERAIKLKSEATIKYDLTDGDDALVLPTLPKLPIKAEEVEEVERIEEIMRLPNAKVSIPSLENFCQMIVEEAFQIDATAKEASPSTR